jgi:thiol-disulfide isomerase/thioredoxin
MPGVRIGVTLQSIESAMRVSCYAIAVALLVASTAGGRSQATESSITAELKGLRGVADAQRPAATVKIADEIGTLPAGKVKLQLADALTHLVTEGDPGRATLQRVADTLARSLEETPLPKTGDAPAAPYMDLAKLARYEQITTDIESPMLRRADEILAANDADVQKADFTLKDLKGKTYTLSQLHGRIVLVNFWATWCPPCRKEMPDLDAIDTHFQSQGLVVLSLTDEDPGKVKSFFGGGNYHPAVLLDTGGAVAKAFHVDGIPKTFVFDREGKLVAQSIDMRTQHQFLLMLSKAGLHP